MPWLPLIIGLIPEIVRGAISICKERIALERAEEERKKAEAEAKKHEHVGG